MEYLESERKLEACEAIQPKLKITFDITTEEFAEFLEYKHTLGARQRLYRNFTDENGHFTMYEKGTTRDKQALNELSAEIHEYEKKIEEGGSPIFDMLVREMRVELPDFLTRDGKGRYEIKKTEIGWYQNSVGVLYHYDGVVWDEVPTESIENLEFLGG